MFEQVRIGYRGFRNYNYTFDIGKWTSCFTPQLANRANRKKNLGQAWWRANNGLPDMCINLVTERENSLHSPLPPRLEKAKNISSHLNPFVLKPYFSLEAALYSELTHSYPQLRWANHYFCKRFATVSMNVW